MPTCFSLSEMVWPILMLMAIVERSRSNASTFDGDGRKTGDTKWKEFTMLELKAFLAITLYINMGKKFNVKRVLDKDNFNFSLSHL